MRVFWGPRPSLPALWLQKRWMAEVVGGSTGGPKMSAEAARALGSIKETMQVRQQVHLSKSERRNFKGNIGKYMLHAGKPEFHNVDRNGNGRIFEPFHTFEVVITSSKNNCWIAVKNNDRGYRCVIVSHAGNVGYRKAAKKTEAATYAIGCNIARKLKRLGVTCADVTFRRLMKVETVLQAFQAIGLQVTKLTHRPRLPQGDPAKPRKQRRV